MLSHYRLLVRADTSASFIDYDVVDDVNYAKYASNTVSPILSKNRFCFLKLSEELKHSIKL